MMKRYGFLVVLVLFFILSGGQRVGAQDKQAFVKIGCGWSENSQIKIAVQEAVSSAQNQMGNNLPEYVILFSTVDYDSAEVLKEVRSALGNKVKVYGGTSCLGVITNGGLHIGKQGSLALLAVSSDKISFGVGSADLDKASSPREAGKKAMLSAIKDAGKLQKEQPALVLMTAAPGHEEEIITGITDVIGKWVPVVGGSSGDNTIEGLWKQYANDHIYSNGLALTAIYTDLAVGIAYQSEYLRTINKGVITKAKGRVIYEIDSKPAAEVYNEWLNGELGDVLKTGGSILARTSFYPLAKVIHGKEGQRHLLSIHPLSFNLPDKSLTVFANVKTGEEIELMRGTWELLLNRARNTTAQALKAGKIKEKEALFGIFTFCAGAILAIPEEERAKMPYLINSVLKGRPFIGSFTFGEQGCLSGVGNVHGNLVNSMIIFSKK